MHLPNFDQFVRLAQGVNLVPVYRQLLSDTLTPVSAYCNLGDSEHAFLFESVVGGERVGRYSFVGTNPFLTMEATRNQICIRRPGQPDETRFAKDPLAELETLLVRYRAAAIPQLPRFCGGAVGYAGYDTVRYVEQLPNAPEDDRNLPDLAFALYDRMIIFDHINKTILVVAHADVCTGDIAEAYQTACEKVDSVCRLLAENTHPLALCDVARDGEVLQLGEYESNFTEEQFEAAIRKGQEYIFAGDIFQFVFSQRFRRKTTATPLDIYRALRVVNPSPFMFLLKHPSATLVGSSPEILVRVEDGITTIRPLAGTRRRGKTEAEDNALEAELLADEKERAEHVMLIDLARNDVGRVAKFGSVVLSDVMQVERYSHVMHITSNVMGELAAGKTTLDALRSGLPAGTVSGAPKVRAMEIIDELEPHRRGPYGGAVGYLDFTGNMDTCIALRTLVIMGDTVYLQAGAGIVADSVPKLEFEETQNKARGLMKAIEIAERQLSQPGSRT